MRILIAGATGVMGRPLMRALVAAGHDVTGTSRHPGRIRVIEELGGHGVVCDPFDLAELHAAFTAARPEIVVQQLTAIPKAIDLRRYPEQMADTHRLWQEGTRDLVNAAVAAGARLFVAQSIALFVYRPDGEWVKHEDAPLAEATPEPLGETIRAAANAERVVLNTDSIAGIVLRNGYLYGPGTAYASDGSMAAAVRAGAVPVIGAGTGRYSFVHVDDAVAATVAALSHGTLGVYNVVDDEPAPRAEWLPVYAAALGAPEPPRVSVEQAARDVGDVFARQAVIQRGAANDKARRDLSWQPRYPTWRTGFAADLNSEQAP